LNAWLQRWRRELALAGCLALTAGVLFLSDPGHWGLTHRSQSLLESLAARAELHSLSLRLAEAETGQKSFLLTYDRESLQPYRDAVPDIRRLIDQLRAHYAAHPDMDATRVFGVLVAAIGAKMGELELTLALIDRARPDRALEIVASGIGRTTMDEIRLLLDELSQREDAYTRGIVREWRANLSLSRFGIALVATLNVILVAALFYGLKRAWRVAAERQRALDRNVRERAHQLDLLATRLQHAAEAERAALARELHDELGALLTASRMDIAWVRGRLGAEHAALHERLGRVVHHLDQGMVTKRRIVEGLRPSTLSTFGLATAARQLSEQVSERAGWRLDLDLPAADPRLPDSIEIALFRVLQESLTNAARHAQARRLRVRLECDALECRLEVEDDGTGFDPRAIRREAQGLFGMRQRAESCGGRFEVRSAPGRGTLIHAVLPRAAVQAREAALPLPGGRRPVGLGPTVCEAPGIASI
jgi:signal transduction histidine kinase